MQEGMSKKHRLIDLNINQCTGCYTCWTKKTPGLCIHNDDMHKLLADYSKADLIIFASPLYIFNVTGIMKTFMDRLLPIFEPYIHINEKKDGAIAHPNRYATNKEQSFIVFSAAGFPNIDNNFDALKKHVQRMGFSLRKYKPYW